MSHCLHCCRQLLCNINITFSRPHCSNILCSVHARLVCVRKGGLYTMRVYIITTFVSPDQRYKFGKGLIVNSYNCYVCFSGLYNIFLECIMTEAFEHHTEQNMSPTKKPTAPSQQHQNYNVKFIRNSCCNVGSQHRITITLQVSHNLLTRCRVICLVTDTLSDELHRDPAELMHHWKQKGNGTDVYNIGLAGNY